MNDKHLNVFHAYGGRRRREDNLTRALIVTLDALPSGLARRVLLDVLGRHHSKLAQRIDVDADAPLEVDLQVNPDDAPGTPTADSCWVVSVDATGQATMADPSLVEGGSRPDAHIHDPVGPLHLAIESKFTTNRQPGQLARHYAAMTGGEGEGRIVSVTWADFTRALEAAAEDPACPEWPRHLVEEFVAFADQFNRAHLGSIRPDEIRHTSNPSDMHKRLVREVFSQLEGPALRLEPAPRRRYREFSIDGLDSENLWLNVHDDGFVAGVVVGSGSKKVAGQIRRLFEDHPDRLRSIGDTLSDQVTDIEPTLEVRYRQQLRIWSSHFRDFQVVLAGVGDGPFRHPGDFEAFRSQFCSAELNPHDWLPRSEVDQRFGDIADRQGYRRGDDGLFPHFKPVRKDALLVHAFLTLTVILPRPWLLDTEPARVVEVLRAVLSPLVETADAVRDARRLVA